MLVRHRYCELGVLVDASVVRTQICVVSVFDVCLVSLHAD